MTRRKLDGPETKSPPFDYLSKLQTMLEHAKAAKRAGDIETIQNLIAAYTPRPKTYGKPATNAPAFEPSKRRRKKG